MKVFMGTKSNGSVQMYSSVSFFSRIIFFWLKQFAIGWTMFEFNTPIYNYKIYGYALSCGCHNKLDKEILTETFKTEMYNEAIYVSKLNVFQFYISMCALFYNNVFEEYIATVILLHNSIVALLIPTIASNRIKKFKLVGLDVSSFRLIYLVAAFSFAECIILVCKIYFDRFRINLQIFKKIGANERINRAYATRMRLKSVARIALFLALIILGKEVIPPCSPFSISVLGSTLAVAVTCILQAFIYVNFNDEDVTQRKVVIILYFVKIFIIVAFKTNYLVNGPKAMIVSDVANLLELMNILIVSFIVFYTVISDYTQFGSGLKEYLKSNKKYLDLSEKCQ